MLDPQKTLHTSAYRASSFVKIGEKIDNVTTAPHCIWTTVTNCLCPHKHFAMNSSPCIIRSLFHEYDYTINVISKNIFVDIILPHDKVHSDGYFHEILS